MMIYGSKYETKLDDFEIMMKNPIFEKTLFIFNDNITEHYSNKKGRGNAVMRKYNQHSNGITRSHGIPTGVHRTGYSKLDDKTKMEIDSAFTELENLINSGYYTSILYSLDNNENFLIGTSIFSVDHEVLVYITKKILFFGTTFNFIKNGKIESECYNIDEIV